MNLQNGRKYLKNQKSDKRLKTQQQDKQPNFFKWAKDLNSHYY